MDHHEQLLEKERKVFADALDMHREHQKWVCEQYTHVPKAPDPGWLDVMRAFNEVSERANEQSMVQDEAFVAQYGRNFAEWKAQLVNDVIAKFGGKHPLVFQPEWVINYSDTFLLKATSPCGCVAEVVLKEFLTARNWLCQSPPGQNRPRTEVKLWSVCWFHGTMGSLVVYAAFQQFLRAHLGDFAGYIACPSTL